MPGQSDDVPGREGVNEARGQTHRTEVRELSRLGVGGEEETSQGRNLPGTCTASLEVPNSHSRQPAPLATSEEPGVWFQLKSAPPCQSSCRLSTSPFIPGANCFSRLPAVDLAGVGMTP